MFYYLTSRGKQMNMRLAEHFIALCDSFNRFKNTGVQIIDSIYHMT